MRVQVCIPHYFREHANPKDNPNGYGSLRSGVRLKRTIALSRCITGILGLQRNRLNGILNYGEEKIITSSNLQEELEININLCTDESNRIDDVIDLFKNQINHIVFKTNNPLTLPLMCRDYLINTPCNADLLCYLEDDIIINDPLYFDKLLWFHSKTSNNFSLMPHRYEPFNNKSIDNLLIDGPLDSHFISQFAKPQRNVASGQFQGKEMVSFDITDNPHSGTFCLSRAQADCLRGSDLPQEGFVGPLETAATLTVLHRFPVMKPSWECWRFLKVEHGHPSFLHCINKFPHHAAN